VLAVIFFAIFASSIVFCAVLAVAQQDARKVALYTILVLLFTSAVFFVVGAKFLAIVSLFLVFLKFLIYLRLPTELKESLFETEGQLDAKKDEMPELPSNVKQIAVESGEIAENTTADRAVQKKTELTPTQQAANFIEPFGAKRWRGFLLALSAFVLLLLPVIFFSLRASDISANNTSQTQPAIPSANLSDNLLVLTGLLLIFIGSIFLAVTVHKKAKISSHKNE